MLFSREHNKIYTGSTADPPQLLGMAALNFEGASV